MSTRIDYTGTPRQLPAPNAQWSNTGGVFQNAYGDRTYFPVPLKYSEALTTLRYYTVPVSMANRPDLIANELYGTSDYWWLVLWASKIVDPFYLPAGTKIRVVSLPELHSVIS